MTETDTETATNTEEMGISVGVVSQYLTGCWISIGPGELLLHCMKLLFQ